MFDQEKWQNWAGKLKPVSIGLAGLILASVFVFKWTGGNKKTGLEDFLSVNPAFDKWSQDPSLENWQKLQKKIDAHPELYQKFGAAIAQRFLYKGEVSDHYFQSLLRNEDVLGFYVDFGKTSEKIAHKQYEKALEEASFLKGQMESQPNSLLYAVNLVRVAMLQKELGWAQLELDSWKEFRSYSGWTTPSQDLFTTEIGKKLAKHFCENEIDLQDYILYREKTLSSY